MLEGVLWGMVLVTPYYSQIPIGDSNNSNAVARVVLILEMWLC
uniref:Uncharacterized protein n=1 Tax=Rhizophora mucronata TaxID=61149 RepID=A0A2P2Q8L8_RHIMU